MAELTFTEEAVHNANVQEFDRYQKELERLNGQLATLLGNVDAFVVKLSLDPLVTPAHVAEVGKLRKSVDETRLAAKEAKKAKAG